MKLKNYFSLLKPRVMSLSIFTSFVGIMIAPGFVFNLEKWVFENLDMIKTYLIESNTLFNNYSKILADLSIRKSRINAQRIWKIYILEKYLKDYFDDRNS